MMLKKPKIGRKGVCRLLSATILSLVFFTEVFAVLDLPPPIPATKISGVASRPVRITDEVNQEFCDDKSKWPPNTVATRGMASPNQLVSIRNITGVSVQRNDSGNGMLRPEAKVALAQAANIANNVGYTFSVASTYRTVRKQVELFCEKNMNTRLAAYPGGSNHGNGVAVDIQLVKDGTSVTTSGTKVPDNENTKILNAIMIAAGWARYCPEVWHFEYGTGTSPGPKGVRQDCTDVPSEKVSSEAGSIDRNDVDRNAVNQQTIEVELQTSLAPLPQGENGGDVCVETPEKRRNGSYYCDDRFGNTFKRDPEAKKWRQVLVSKSGDENGGVLMQYVSLLYRFLAGIIGLLSVLMLVVGGIQISMSGVSQEGLQGGKDRIIAALAGLVLLFLSGILLHAVNPTFFTL